MEEENKVGKGVWCEEPSPVTYPVRGSLGVVIHQAGGPGFGVL